MGSHMEEEHLVWFHWQEGVKTQAPLTHLDRVQESLALQTIGALIHVLLEQESMVQGSSSLQSFCRKTHPPFASSHVEMKQSPALHEISSDTQVPFGAQKLLRQAVLDTSHFATATH